MVLIFILMKNRGAYFKEIDFLFLTHPVKKDLHLLNIQFHYFDKNLNLRKRMYRRNLMSDSVLDREFKRVEEKNEK